MSATSENASFQRVLLEFISASTTRVRRNATMDEPRAESLSRPATNSGLKRSDATETTLRSVSGAIDLTVDVSEYGSVEVSEYRRVDRYSEASSSASSN